MDKLNNIKTLRKLSRELSRENKGMQKIIDLNTKEYEKNKKKRYLSFKQCVFQNNCQFDDPLKEDLTEYM